MKLNKLSDTSRSGLISMCLKPIGMLLSFLYTPLLLSYLGDEKYGLWVTVLSIINWINYFDVGIGHGLRNLLSKELGTGDYESAKRSISTAYTLLTGIASSLLLVLIILTFSVNWNSVFSTSIDMRLPLLISFVFICVNFILALANSILYAMQKSEWVSIRNCLTQFLNLTCIFILKQISDGNLVFVSVVFGSTTMIVHIYNTVKILHAEKEIEIRFRLLDKNKIGAICNVGIKFFIIQIMCVLVFTVDNLIITHYFGAVEATSFSMVEKVFNMAYTIFAALLTPYWSRTTLAYSQKDFKWIINAIKKTSIICVAFSLGYVLIVPLFKTIVGMWLGKNLNYQYGIIPLMCFYYICYSILNVESQFINGIGDLNVQLMVYCVIGLANVPFSIWLGKSAGLGPFGVRLASTVLLFVAIIILGVNLFTIIRREKSFTESMEK